MHSCFVNHGADLLVNKRRFSASLIITYYINTSLISGLSRDGASIVRLVDTIGVEKMNLSR